MSNRFFVFSQSHLNCNQGSKLAALEECRDHLHEQELLSISTHSLDIESTQDEGKERKGNEDVAPKIATTLTFAFRYKFSGIANQRDKNTVVHRG